MVQGTCLRATWGSLGNIQVPGHHPSLNESEFLGMRVKAC